MQDDDELIECPNCQCLSPRVELKPISIGALIRYAKRMEQAQRLLIKSGQAQTAEGKLVPLTTLFNDYKIQWLQLPPLLEQLHYNVQEMGTHKSLQNKEAHVCVACYNTYSDEAELKRRVRCDKAAEVQEKKKAANAIGISPRSPRLLSTTDLTTFSRFSDRKSDFAFTTLQATIRSRERLIDEKKRARQRLVETQGPSEALDWEGLPATATREIRLLQDAASETLKLMPPPSSGALSTMEDVSPRRLDTHHSPSRTGSAAIRRGVSASASLPSVSVPLTEEELHDIYTLTGLVTPLEQDPKTSFDVPIQHRFMHELWFKLSAEMEFGVEDQYLYLSDVKGEYLLKKNSKGSEMTSPSSSKPPAEPLAAGTTNTPAPPSIIGVGVKGEGISWAEETLPTTSIDFASSGVAHASPTRAIDHSDSVPIRHPFFLLYRKNHLRLPTPPVPIMVQKPTVISTSANVDDAVLKVDHAALVNSKQIRRFGMQSNFFSRELTVEEQEMLVEVIADETIVVDDMENSDMFDFESEEGEEYVEEDQEEGTFADY